MKMAHYSQWVAGRVASGLCYGRKGGRVVEASGREVSEIPIWMALDGSTSTSISGRIIPTTRDMIVQQY